VLADIRAAIPEEMTVRSSPLTITPPASRREVSTCRRSDRPLRNACFQAALIAPGSRPVPLPSSERERRRASYGGRMHARPASDRDVRLRCRSLLALTAVVVALSGCTADVPGPSPTSAIVTAARQDTRPLFDEAMAVEAVPGVREVARATEDWCFGEGGSDRIGESGSVVTTVCRFDGGIVYAVDGTDQYAAAEVVDRFLAANGIHGPGGRVVDSLVGVDLLQSGEISGGGGRGLPGGGANGAATVRWTLVAASRLQVDGLPLPQGFNRQSYEGSITESTPAEVRAMSASFALSVDVGWRYFTGTGDGSLPSS
jgi:hypothetical protein